MSCSIRDTSPRDFSLMTLIGKQGKQCRSMIRFLNHYHWMTNEIIISQINPKKYHNHRIYQMILINSIFYRLATRKTVSPLLWNSTNKIEHDLLSSPEYPSTSSDLRMIPQPPPPPKVYYIQQQRQRGRHQHAVNFT